MKLASTLGRVAEVRGLARWLALALVAQLALAGTLSIVGARAARFTAPGPLVALDTASVDALEIAAADGAITLERDGDGWRLAESALPADAARIEARLATLASLDGGLPVATSASARAQLDVADDDFQRRIVLSAAGDALATLYVGTSPGFRRAHMRRDGADAVHAVELNVYDLPADADGWLDKGLLAIDAPTHIAGDGWTLEKNGEDWTLADLAEDETMVVDAASAIAEAVAGLRVTGLASEAAIDDAGAESERMTVSITNTDEERELVFERRGAAVTVRRDDVDAAFDVAPASFDLLNIGRESLAQVPDA